MPNLMFLLHASYLGEGLGEGSGKVNFTVYIRLGAVSS